MMISTKGRYALRVLLDLAQQGAGHLTPMKDVAARQGLSLKYIERIVPALVKTGLLTAAHGKGGGYRLTREPADYRVGEILRLMEGNLAPVSCLEEGAEPCPRAAECQTLAMWQGFYRLTNDYFDGITLADLLNAPTAANYVI